MVILFYDYLLTLAAEVSYIWAGDHKRSSAWFLFVRYFSLCSTLAMLSLTFGNFSPERCRRLHSAHELLIVIQELTVGSTLALRVCALYGFNKRVIFSLAVAAIITMALGIWSLLPAAPAPLPSIQSPLAGCHTTKSKAQSIRTATAWDAQLLCDALVLGLTLHQGYKQMSSFGGSLWRVVIRDGAMYFGVICLATLANILMYYFAETNVSGSLASFIVALSVAMVCRMMLNLHQATTGFMDPSTVDATELSSINFDSDGAFVVLRFASRSEGESGDLFV
ncbi:hypothetical protein B0H10DRAFT_2438461 [Mycena sp. CBHHK59/15]|nr:hypothetical protein B0H10DRAFT_2438461 [Mycena sp. CBHHK59/15]